MDTFDIIFAVQGGVTQTVKITDPYYSVARVKAMLLSGEAATTISYDRDCPSEGIIETATGKVLGLVVSQEITDETEYDFHI